MKAIFKAQGNPMISAFLGTMVAVIIAAAVLYPTIQDQITAISMPVEDWVTELNVDGTTASVVTLEHGRILTTGFAIKAQNTSNPTQTYSTSNYTLDVGSVVDHGTVTFGTINASYPNANISYQYYPDTYIEDSGLIVTLLNLLPLLLTLLILIGAVALVKF